jgi:hypothetical protein
MPNLKPSDARMVAMLGACVIAQGNTGGATFRDDVSFLQAHTDIVILSNRVGNAKLVLAPAWQGRVMTSTAQGDGGASFGWMNRELIASHKTQAHINVYGGEDRFWLGPEGGQFSIFFAKGVPFDLEHWFTPPSLDTEPFELVDSTRSRADFRRQITLTNYSGATFELTANRSVRILEPRTIWRALGMPAVKGVVAVGFESINRIQNSGPAPWTKESGLLSIWILGMFNPSPTTTIVVPIQPGLEKRLGKPVNSDYFGPVPADRLVVRDDVVFFSGDGKFRSKIGISPLRCKPILGSYDAARKALTLIQLTMPPGETNYVNSMWQIQSHPYSGDVVNSYNDGPPSPGAKPLGPFYEMESSSPAAALAPGKSLEHTHRTIHLVGTEDELDRIARATLGTSIAEIVRALPHSASAGR